MAVVILLVGIGLGILFGVLTGSVLAGVIVAIIGIGFLSAKWAQAGAVMNMSTQKERDKQIINELKKMNEKE